MSLITGIYPKTDPASCCVSIYWFYLVQNVTTKLLKLKKLIGLLTRRKKHILPLLKDKIVVTFLFVIHKSHGKTLCPLSLS